MNYNVEGWLDKNKDPLNDSVVELLKKSSDPFIAQIWSDYISSADGSQRKGKGSQFITVGQRHKVRVHVCTLQRGRLECDSCKLDKTAPLPSPPPLVPSPPSHDRSL